MFMMNQINVQSSKLLRRKHIVRQSINVPSLLQTAFFSDDSRRQHTNNLRVLRKGKSHPGDEGKPIDYRLRGNSGLGEQLDRSIEDFWGEAAMEEEAERQKTNKQKDTTTSTSNRTKQSHTKISSQPEFISFFDEVDAKMALLSKKNVDIKTVPLSMRNRDRMRNETKTSNSLDRLFDALQDRVGPPSVMKTESDHPQSIFDAFPLKPKVKYDPNAYEKQSFEQYRVVMMEITESDRFTRKQTRKPISEDVFAPVIDWLLKDTKTLAYEYKTLKDAEENGISINTVSVNNISESEQKQKAKLEDAFRSEVSIDGTQANIFHLQLKEQHESFVAKTQFSREQMELADRALSVLASNCAKMIKSAPLSIAWEKIKEAGMIPSNDTLNVILYVTGTMSSSFLSSTIGGSKKLSAVMSILDDGKREKGGNSDDKDPIDFPTELALFHDLLYTPTEKSVSLRVKRLVSIGDANGAEDLLDSFPTNDDAKLRTYLPVLKLYCEQGNVSSALRLFKRMRDEPFVRLEPENYILLISTFAEHGYFNANSEPMEGAKEVGYKHECGPNFFDELITQMSEDVLEISGASARRLYNALADGMQHQKFTNQIKSIHSLAGVVQENDKAGPNDLIASRVAVGKSTGQCPRSGIKLRLITLERKQRQQLHHSLLELSTNRFEEFNSTRRKSDRSDDYAAEKLNQFSAWLDEREGEPFTAIIDGANVAYYMQNFDQGCFNYHQIQFVVDALEKSNENPLVILPYKYCRNSFSIYMGSKSIRQVLSKKEKQILQKLTEKNQLYRVPGGCLDDYYWMLASVSNQTRSRNEVDLHVPTDNTEGRWPGTRPMLITNDQMRDHKLGLMEPRLFRRWTSCYIVNYSFTAFVKAESIDREIGFSTADFFSREIQRNETNTGAVWHFPVSDWDLDDRFCIRIPDIIRHRRIT